MAEDPDALLRKADKALSGAGSGFSFFGGRSDKYENAVDLYTQAAIAYKTQRRGNEAGKAFEKAASVQATQLNEKLDAANSLNEAFKAYRSTSPEDAARVLDQAVKSYTSQGNFRRAATHMQTLGEIYENDIGDQKRALEAFSIAAGWFEDDNAPALANKLYLKCGDLAALEGDYYAAIKHFETVAKRSVDNNLMRWSVKEYFLKAGICHLCTKDLVATNRALDSYRDMDPSFPTQREHQLLVDLTQSIEQGDQDLFQDRLFQYDQISKLDKWKTTLLLRVKENIEGAEEDFS